VKIEEHQSVSILGRQGPERTLNQATLFAVLQVWLGATRIGRFRYLIESDRPWRDPPNLRPVQVGGQRKEPRRKGRLTAPFREPAERFDEGFLGHFLGATAVVAKAVSHIDERTLPAANDLLECGEISLQYAINGSLVVRRAHDLPDMSTVRLPPCSTGCVLFQRKKTQPARDGRCLTDRSARKACGRESVGLFLFLSVAVASVFTFIAVIAWAGERRKEREAYYHSEVVKKIAESPGSGVAAQEYMRERQRISDRNTRGTLRLVGLILFAAGGGLMIFFDALREGPPPALGAIPMLVGLALLFYGQFLAPKD